MIHFIVNNQKYYVEFGYPKNLQNKAEISYSQRLITIHTNYMHHPKLLHLITHEVTHAYIYETQVVKGVYDEESVCELMAMYGAQIVSTSKRILNKIIKMNKS